MTSSLNLRGKSKSWMQKRYYRSKQRYQINKIQAKSRKDAYKKGVQNKKSYNIKSRNKRLHMQAYNRGRKGFNGKKLKRMFKF